MDKFTDIPLTKPRPMPPSGEKRGASVKFSARWCGFFNSDIDIFIHILLYSLWFIISLFIIYISRIQYYMHSNSFHSVWCFHSMGRCGHQTSPSSMSPRKTLLAAVCRPYDRWRKSHCPNDAEINNTSTAKQNQQSRWHIWFKNMKY